VKLKADGRWHARQESDVGVPTRVSGVSGSKELRCGWELQ
jgi:hypothetical protein